MDITGTRWSVHGAEAVLKARAVRANDDVDDYWKSTSKANDTESTRRATPAARTR